jgi:hypothetical protein
VQSLIYEGLIANVWSSADTARCGPAFTQNYLRERGEKPVYDAPGPTSGSAPTAGRGRHETVQLLPGRLAQPPGADRAEPRCYASDRARVWFSSAGCDDGSQRRRVIFFEIALANTEAGWTPVSLRFFPYVLWLARSQPVLPPGVTGLSHLLHMRCWVLLSAGI